MQENYINKIDLMGMGSDELQEYLKVMDSKPYRGSQILDWVYSKNIKEIERMTNLPGKLKEDFQKEFYISGLLELQEQVSLDKTRKYLFQLEDGQKIESVLIPDDKRLTLCVSTQVGCKFNCSFCYTGKMGYIRNLTAGEIINQIITVKQQDKKITNIVFMGMGEPLDNYENVIKAVKIISSSWGLGISPGKITLSTCGLVPGLKRLKDEKLNINLSISLNASNNGVRSLLMPVNKKYPISELLRACRGHPLQPGKRITFEYILIKDLNDSEKDAKQLADLLKGIRCKINLLPFNKKSNDKNIYDTPDRNRVNKFHEYLISRKFIVFTRKPRGIDISAACGQLAT